MTKRNFFKLLTVLSLLAIAGWSVVGHPNFMNQYAFDPRSKPDLRTNCAICHAPEGRRTDPNFLTKFGRVFQDNGNKITPEMRDEFPVLFTAIDKEVSAQPVDVIKLATEQVVINVTVKDAKGKYVTGLDQQAFTLLEDNKEQEVAKFLGEDAPLAVAVVIDTSGSTLEKDMDRIVKSVLDLANRLRVDDVLAIYAFGEGGVQQIRDYASSIRDLKPLLKQLKGQGDTPLYDAVLRATADLKNRPERRRAMILISDGADTTSQKTLHEAGRETFLAGVSIYSVDLVNTKREAKRSPERQAGATALRQLAEETGGRYITATGGFFTTSRGQLKKIFTDLIDEWHKQYTMIYEPNNTRRAGRWRTIRINMEQSDLSARTRLGYREGVQ
ncbi:MAG TPA: VWA domain-containing protein [Blastocatellia bacterium]|nr:VWA domain-containing protein [Blastocatellia bacterium]